MASFAELCIEQGMIQTGMFEYLLDCTPHPKPLSHKGRGA